MTLRRRATVYVGAYECVPSPDVCEAGSREAPKPRHLDRMREESILQRAVNQAVWRAGVPKRASPHTLRHSLATPTCSRTARHPHRPRPAGPRDVKRRGWKGERRSDEHDRRRDML